MLNKKWKDWTYPNNNTNGKEKEKKLKKVTKKRRKRNGETDKWRDKRLSQSVSEGKQEGEAGSLSVNMNDLPWSPQQPCVSKPGSSIWRI